MCNLEKELKKHLMSIGGGNLCVLFCVLNDLVWLYTLLNCVLECCVLHAGPRAK